MTPPAHAPSQVPTVVLYRPHVRRQILTILGSGLVFAVATVCLGSLFLDWQLASSAGSAIFSVVGIWFAVAILAPAPVLVLGDLQQPGFLRRAAHVIELAPEGIRLHDPLSGHTASQADGSLRVFRSNVYGAKSSLHGGLALQTAHGTLLVHPWQRLGAWSGLPVAPSARSPLPVDPQFFDAMLRRAT